MKLKKNISKLATRKRLAFVVVVLMISVSLILAQHQIFAAPATFTDDFNRADGAVGNGWTVEGSNPKTYSISGGKVIGDDAAIETYNTSRLMRQETGFNQTVSTDMKFGEGKSMGLILREQGTGSSNGTAYGVYSSAVAVRLFKNVNGTVTNLWDSGITLNKTDIYRITNSVTGKNPTTICTTVENLTTSTNIINNHCVTDSTAGLQATGRAGFYIPNSNFSQDNFSYTYEEEPTPPTQPPFSLSPIFSDDFNRANGAVGNGWTNQGTAKKGYNIINNEITGGGTASQAWNESLLIRPETALNQVVSVDLSRDTVVATGIVLREQGTVNTASTAYGAFHSTGIKMYKNIAGAVTTFWDSGISMNTTDTYRFRLSAIGANPTQLCLTVNNITTSTTIIDNHCEMDSTPQLQSAGKAGFYIPNTTHKFDNFNYQEAVASDEYSTYTVKAEDLWDNGYPLISGNPRNSSFSRFIFDTTSDFAIVNMVIAGVDWQNPMAVKVDGVVKSSISSANNTISLGNPGATKRVEITTGGNKGMTPAGNYLTTIQYDKNESLMVVTPQIANDRVLVFGDSITVGWGNLDAPNSAITPRLRKAGYSAMSEGSSGDTLARWNQGTATASSFTNLINRLVSYAPKTIWIEMGHNDAAYLSSSWGNNVNNFGNAYAILVDGLHSALPNAHIFCQSMMRVDGAYRSVGDKILEVCNNSSRNSYVASVDAKGWITGYGTEGTYMAEAFHPNDAGNVMYANRASEYLATLNPNISKTSGSDNFTESQASSNLEYTIADSSTNADAKLVNRLVKVNINGNTVNPLDYNITGTPVVLSLSQTYLNTLSSGTKSLDVYFTGNIKASSSFNVAQDNSTAPDAPTSLSATPASTQVALTWSVPSSDGGSAITDYIVQYKETNSGSWNTFNDGTSTNTNATVTSLTNGTSYDFRVAAVNSVGTGTYSSNASAKPATTPSVPTSLSVAPEPAGIKLIWTAPNNGGEDITDYIVQFKKTSDSSWTTFNEGTNTNTTTTVTGLELGTSYDFRVAAVNSVGTGSFGSPETATSLANAVQFNNLESSKLVVLTTPNNTDITCHSSIKEESLASQDGQFSYPMGLIDFCFDTAQSNNQVTLTFVTDLNPTDVIARKYNITLGTFVDLPSSASPAITETTVNGQHALVLAYTLEDNGPLDLDNTVGSIKDPVGLAQINQTSSGNNTNDQPANSSSKANNNNNLTNTGTNTTLLSIIALGMVIISVSTYITGKKTAQKNTN